MTEFAARRAKAAHLAIILWNARVPGDDIEQVVRDVEAMTDWQWLLADRVYVGARKLKREARIPSPATKRLVLTHLRTLTAPGEYDWIDQLADATPDSGVRRIA